MAAEGLKNIKEVIRNKAYRINPNDRKIFEEGDMQSFFGLSEDDLIEFIVYDSSENQLPQKGYGSVRYIPLTTENINDYFLLAEGTTVTKNNLPSEFFIDVERLIKEAGFTNGVFKTQISLFNKRLGSYKEKDKVWISEISPSRTELRLFPLMTSPNIKDIKERFNIFYTNGDFRSDVIYNIFKMVEATSASIITDTIKRTYGESFYNKLKTEYKIQNFDTFAVNIHKKFIESVQYEYTNRISNLKDVNYGKKKKTPPTLQLSEDTIMKTLSILIINAINFYLPQKDEQLNPRAVQTTDSSVDDYEIGVLQSKKSDELIDTKIPERKMTIVEKPPVRDDLDPVIGFRRRLLRDLPIERDEPPPIVLPVEKEKPITGEIIVIDLPPIDPVMEDMPIRIERPVRTEPQQPQIIPGSGGVTIGGGGSPVNSGGGAGSGFGGGAGGIDLGAGSGREQVYETDMTRRPERER